MIRAVSVAGDKTGTASRAPETTHTIKEVTQSGR